MKLSEAERLRFEALVAALEASDASTAPGRRQPTSFAALLGERARIIDGANA